MRKDKVKRRTPPKLAQKFLRWFIRDDLSEEVQGDLEEQFYTWLEKTSAHWAKVNYWFQVFHYLRPFAIRKSKPTYLNSNFAAMFRHNLIISFRNFRRNKTTFFINLIGLSTGLACAFLIYLWVNDELNMDRFNEKDAQLFTVMGNQHYSDGIVTNTNTPGPLAEALSEKMPEIEYATTTSKTETYSLALEDTYIKAVGLYASQDYFNVFSYHLLQGNKNQVLADKSSIVLSEKLAATLFHNSENIIGKIVTFQDHRQYEVSGVFGGTPTNSSLQFDFILSFEAYKTEHPWVLDWGNNATHTYLVLTKGTNPNKFNKKISGFINQRKKGLNITLFLAPYSDNYLHGNYKNGMQAGGRIEYVRLFSLIALFILVIACINFMNLSTAKASKRLKEVAVKKTLGAGRKTLVFQYLGESLTMAFLALIAAILLVAIFLPQFNQITSKDLALNLNPTLILCAFGITLFTGFFAGSYPALYLSGFNPVTILKGKYNGSPSELWARKGLVIFQFAISIILIVAVLVVYKQLSYIQTTNLGYDKDNILYFEIEGRIKENIETALSEIKRLPGIVNASSIDHNMVGGGNTTGGVLWPGKSPDDKVPIEFVNVNYDMIETLGIEMAEGRAFSKNFGSDSTKIIFNKAAIDMMGLTNPIGKVVNLWGKDMQIIGVTKNFHFASLHQTIKPLLFRLAPDKSNKIMVKIEADKMKATIAALQKFYHQYNPGSPFDYHFLDQDYQALYVAEQRVSVLSRYFAGIAILISCLGLFGLAAFTAERRQKEIGIRKILGANSWGIIYLLSTDFIKMVLIAIMIALPISYYITKNWLDGFAYRIDLKWWYFVGSGLLAMLITWFTVGLQTVKAARINPVGSLRSE